MTDNSGIWRFIDLFLLSAVFFRFLFICVLFVVIFGCFIAIVLKKILQKILRSRIKLLFPENLDWLLSDTIMCHPEASSRVKVPRSTAIMEMYTIIPISAFGPFSVNPSLRVFEIPAYHEKSLTLDSSPCLTLSLFSDASHSKWSYQNESSNLLRLAFKSKRGPCMSLPLYLLLCTSGFA